MISHRTSQHHLISRHGKKRKKKVERDDLRMSFCGLGGERERLREWERERESGSCNRYLVNKVLERDTIRLYIAHNRGAIGIRSHYTHGYWVGLLKWGKEREKEREGKGAECGGGGSDHWPRGKAERIEGYTFTTYVATSPCWGGWILSNFSLVGALWCFELSPRWPILAL